MDDKNLEKDLELLAGVNGGRAGAKEDLVRKYAPLVRHIARKYVSNNLEFEDLFQEGLIGLLSAIQQYDYRAFGVKFSSFAYLCVIRRIFNVIRQANNSKHKALNSAVSLQAYISQDESRTLLDTQLSLIPNPEDAVEDEWVGIRLDQTLRNHLSVLEYIVVSRLACGYGMHEIETQLGLTPKAVDNARTRAKLKIRRLMDRHGSLLSPSVPEAGRKRDDLCMRLPAVAK